MNPKTVLEAYKAQFTRQKTINKAFKDIRQGALFLFCGNVYIKQSPKSADLLLNNGNKYALSFGNQQQCQLLENA